MAGKDNRKYSIYILKTGKLYQPSTALISEHYHISDTLLEAFKRHGLDCNKSDLKFIEKLDRGEYTLIDRDFMYDYYVERTE